MVSQTTVPLANKAQRNLSLVCSSLRREGCSLESWVGSLPGNVRVLGAVYSLEPLFGTRTISTRIWKEAGKVGEGSQSSCPVLSTGSLEWKQLYTFHHDRRETALGSWWVHALALSNKLQDLLKPQVL